MKTDHRITRRLALAGVSGLVGTGLLPVRMARADFGNPDIAFELARVFVCADSARMIGSRYLALRPEEADPLVLARRIFADDTDRARRFFRMPLPERRSRIAAQCRNDFAAAKTVVIDRWVLAETEARLCAFAALAAR